MLDKNILAPFNFLRELNTFIFSLTYGKVEDHIPLMCQLRRAATLPPVEQNGMIAAIVFSMQSRTQFDFASMETVQEKILHKTVGNKITPLVVNPGRIVLTDVTLYFQPYNNAEAVPVFKVKLASIKRIFQRRYLLRPLGLEIEYVNMKGKSDHIYLTFNQPSERQKLYHKIIVARQAQPQSQSPQQIPQTLNNTSMTMGNSLKATATSSAMLQRNEIDHPLSPKPILTAPTAHPVTDNRGDMITQNEESAPAPLDIPRVLEEENMTLQWQNGLISNFQYLLYLNSAADRSFNDLTQYPVMPWIISDYTSSELNLSDINVYRDLSKPMGALNEERLQSLKERTADMPEPRFLYGSHYSTPGFVLYFLVRKIPECMLCLQNGRFDHPDRMFNSIPQTWINVTTHHSDFKELVPEFYMPEHKGDFLQNLRRIDFGIRHCGTPVNDVVLPPWAKSPADFVEKLSQALESDYVSRNIHKWIDLVFGYKQRGKTAELANNLFYHLCYEGAVDMEKIHDLEERYALEVQIGEFGQVPKQLFASPHPARIIFEDVEDGNHNHSMTISQQRGVNESKFWKYDMTGMKMMCDHKYHREPLSTVAMSVDNLWVFSSSHDSKLRMYSMEEMHLTRSVALGNEHHDNGGINISCCFPMPNNKTVLVGSWNNSICAYSIEYGRTYQYNGAHRDAISCMDWNKGVLATGSWDASVKVWQCNDINAYQVNLEHDLLSQLEHENQVSAVALCPDNSQLVSGTRDGRVVLWCLESYSIIQELPAHKRQVNGVKFSCDAKRVVSCGSDFYMKVIDLQTGTILFSKDLGEELNCLAFDGQTMIVGGGSGCLSVWDIYNVKPMGKIPAHKGPITCLYVSDDGEFVATGGDDRRIVVWTTKK